MKIETLKIEALIPYSLNNVIHSETQVDRIANSIREFGFNVPLVISKDNVVIAGHGRLLAAQKLGLKEVPVTRADHLTAAQERAYRLLDNALTKQSEWNFENLGIEFNLLEEDGFNFKDWGVEDVFKIAEEAQDAATAAAAAKEDDFEPPVLDEVETFIKRGDLIELGKKRNELQKGCSPKEAHHENYI